jgi:hypothetical protein
MYVQTCGQAATHAEEFVGSDRQRQLSTAPFPAALAANGVNHSQLFEECFAYCARSCPHEHQLLNLSRRRSNRVRHSARLSRQLPPGEYWSGTERLIVGVLCAGGSGFRHTISNAAMTNLATEMHLSELPLHASRLVYEHSTCQIVPAMNARLNLLRAKKIGLDGRKIAFVAVYDAVAVVQRMSACWHSRIVVKVFSDEIQSIEMYPGNGH